jgi:hypothetical protein
MITTTPNRSLGQLLTTCLAVTVSVLLSPSGPLLLSAVIVAAVIIGVVVTAAMIGG